jgi:endo-1,4-beta-xylanase
VVNEPVEIDSSPDGDGALRESFWLETIGPEYIELGFRFAHEADPDAQLIYNQVGIEESSSATSLSLLDGLLERGVPVDGVGFQMHVQLDGEPVLEHVSRLAELMADVAARGLDVYITEMDVAVPEPWTQVKGEDQAAVYDAALTACLNQPACKGFQTWGFTDKYTWISEHFPGWTSPLLFDESYAPKSAYHALLDRLRLEPPKPR